MRSPETTDPLNIDGDSEDVPKLLKANEATLRSDDVVEPVLDD